MEFTAIYKQYWDRVFRLCMGFVNDYDLAQDMAQETFISVWKNLPKYRAEADIGTWIYRIATNNCLRQIEKQKRVQVTDLPFHLPETKQTGIEPQIALLYTFIAQLPEVDRIIISLELEDMPQADIAKIVGLSEVNIRVKIHRIKDRLHKKFKENGK